MGQLKQTLCLKRLRCRISHHHASDTLNLLKPIARLVLIAVVVGYFASAAALLFTRYWVLPRLDQWRPEIEAVMTKSLGAPVKIGEIQAEWHSLNPALSLRDLTVLGNDGEPNLVIPAARAIVSWRSVLHLEPVFSYVGVDEFELTAVQQSNGLVRVAGFDIDFDEPSDPAVRKQVLNWLSKQGRINVTRAKLTWIDQRQNTPPISLTDINLTLENGLLSHRLGATANLPRTLGQSVSLSVRADRLAGSLASLEGRLLNADVFLALPRLNSDALAPWIALPPITGTFGGRAWISLQDGLVDNLTVDLSAADASGGEPNSSGLAWQASHVQTRIEGPLGLLWHTQEAQTWVTRAPKNTRLVVDIEASGVVLRRVSADLQTLPIDTFTLESEIQRPSEQELSVVASELSFANRDGLVTLSGQWQRNDPDSNGQLDIEGTLARFDLVSLPRYLSGAIGTDTQEWMARAFKRGTISQAGFKVEGFVDDFPYGKNKQGLFALDGTFQGWSLDYAPADKKGELGWPPLVDLKGSVNLLADRISVKTDAGALLMPDGERVSITRLSADLVNIVDNPILTVDAQSRAPAKAYLAMLKQTALKKLIPGFVSDLTGSGQWSLPLTMQMDVEDVDNTSFRAILNLNGGDIGYADLPPATITSGTSVFTENGFVAQDLEGTWLGSRLAVTGGINETQHTIEAEGELSWAQLASATKTDVINDLIKGEMPFELRFTAAPGEPQDLRVTSAMAGTQIMLPSPLGKAAAKALPMTLTWQEGASSAPDLMRLKLGSLATLEARLADAKSSSKAPLFEAVALSVGQPAIPLKNGFAAAARFDSLDAVPWVALAERLQKDLVKSSVGRPTFPALSSAKLSAQTFHWTHTVLDALEVDLALQVNGRNDLSLKSTQTAGTVRWQSKNGKIDSRILANFSKVNIGSKKQEGLTEEEKAEAMSSLPKEDALSEVPAIDLTIDELTVFGSRLGKLEVVGQNTADHTRWEIEKLHIENNHGDVLASGVWRFSPNPGISVAAAVNVDNLGEMTDALGLGKRVRNGSGNITAKVEWGEFPWRTEYAALDAQMAIDLKHGVFDGVDSSSARVLELLSLQSLNRLFSLDLGADNSFKDGFPWQSIIGDMSIKAGVANTRNLTVNSTVATISIVGGANLVDETWQLDAEVKPNLDMSGTAIASGFVVNPLVGISALVGQYLLRHPIEKALAIDYSVAGPWDSPIVNGKSTKGEQPNKKAEDGHDAKADKKPNVAIPNQGNQVQRQSTEVDGDDINVDQSNSQGAEPTDEAAYIYKNRRDTDP